MISKRSVPAGIAAAVLAAAILATTAGTTAAAGTTTTVPTVTTAGSKTTAPKTLLAASLGAAGKQSSVHFVATSSVGTRSIKVVADAAATAGSQTIVLREGKATGHVTARYVDKAVYFRGDAEGLEKYLGMPTTLAPKYSDQWIAFSSSTKDYTSIVKSMDLSAALAQISVKAPPKSGGHSTQGGRAAVGVEGTTTTLSSKSKHGTATLYVAAKGSPLPLVYRGTGKQKKQTETGTVIFSKWGETVSPAVPATSVPASSITSSS